MDYITTKEAAAKWGISTTRITVLANEGRIPGAVRMGRSWLIPAGADKPIPCKPGHGKMRSQAFSFPMYLYRPDWSPELAQRLSGQEKRLLDAEIAVAQCRFEEAFPVLEALLHSKCSTGVEVGALFHYAICCMMLNERNPFYNAFLRLEALLANPMPYQAEYTTLLDGIRTYVQSVGSTAKTGRIAPYLHPQCTPLVCMYAGYLALSKEAMEPGSADCGLITLLLRLLETTGSDLAKMNMHCYLLGIHLMRQNGAEGLLHAKAALQIAYEKRFFLPLVTFYRYFTPAIASALEEYPRDFQEDFLRITAAYGEKYTLFLNAISEDSVFGSLSGNDYAYVYAVLQDQSIGEIGRALGISAYAVKRDLNKIYERIGVKNKKELKDKLQGII